MTPRRSVILAAHGAGDESAANGLVHGVAATVASRRPDLEVIAAFNLGEPGFAAALDRSRGEHVTIVPLMTSNGWFVQERLPALLESSMRHGRVPIDVTPPIGALRQVVRAVRDRAVRAALESAAGGGAAAVIVVGHGTTRRSSSGDGTRALAAEIAAVLHRAAVEGEVEVAAAFLDEPPGLEEVAMRFADRRRVIVPFLLGGGDHARRDVRERVLGGAAAAQTNFLPDLSATPSLLVDAALALIDWHDPKRRLRLGTRGSRLALRQAELVATALSARGIETELVVVDTGGDRDQATAIDEFPTDGPFTDDLETALAAGAIDLAVHSQKDLPLPHPATAIPTPETSTDTEVAAVLPRGAVHEALVTTTGSTLKDLAAGSRIGTCSPRRAAQLSRLRPDLRAVPMRGAVDVRLAAVARGEVDGAILAVAGLERLGALDRMAERLTLEQMLPEAGQGAIAVTCRSDDRPARDACKAIDHPATRRAVDLERAIAAAIERSPDGTRRAGVVSAVHASAAASATARFHVHARAIDLRSGQTRDAVIRAEGLEEALDHAVATIAFEESLR